MTMDIRILLQDMVTRHASDLYLTFGSAPAFRVNNAIQHHDSAALNDADLKQFLEAILSPEQLDEFNSTFELNMALNFDAKTRFRINVLRQQTHTAIVIRRIETSIPTLAELNLPAAYGDLALLKRGLILISGQTGSGKSTTLASMVGHRNQLGEGHILTVEDPIEFIHVHNKCIITQRDIGLDTYSYSLALKNALRQRPDLVVIGEVRDREVMEQAIHFAETGHLCIATIHANNASQTIERVINFFPEEQHVQILLNLALNLRATLSQRLLPTIDGKRTLAVEILLNRGLIRQHIEQGKIRELREMIEKGVAEGMQTFDQHLFELFQKQLISEQTAIAESDSAPNLRMMIQNKKMSNSMSDLQPTSPALAPRRTSEF